MQRYRLICWLAVVLGVVSLRTAWSQQDIRPSSPQPPRTQDGLPAPRLAPTTEVDRLQDLAAVLPAELGADLLLKLVESRRVPDAKRVRTIINEAFERAVLAEHSVKRRFVGSYVDSESAQLGFALDMGLDALSLRMRAVRAMAMIDPGAARTLFSQIVVPKAKPASCAAYDWLTEDYDAYYATASVLAQSAFGKPERDQLLHFAQSAVHSIDAVQQVAPTLQFLDLLSVTPQEKSQLLAGLLTNLLLLQPDQISFLKSYARMLQAARKIVASPQFARPERQALVAAIRRMIVSASRQTNCYGVGLSVRDSRSLIGGMQRDAQSADVAALPTPDFLDTWVSVIHLFNVTLASGFGDQALSPSDLDATALKQTMPSGKPVQDGRFWSTPRAGQLLTEFSRLRFHYAEPDKLSSSWQRAVEALADQVVEWSGKGEPSAVTFYHQKAKLFLSLITMPASARMLRQNTNRAALYGQVAVAESERARLLQRFVEFVDGPNGQQTYREVRLHWLVPVIDLMRHVQQYSPADRAVLINAMKGAKNPALSALALQSEVGLFRP